ncbi:hypothetical protein AGMMS49942_23940 [Spirochaetia bacterium]|nr:hypothetical protein AGMMS49942_23940 [Spirochaetia bacterium]
MELSIEAKKSPGLNPGRRFMEKSGIERIYNIYKFGLEIFFHPDYTVGAGISPDRSRTCELLVRTIPDSRAITADWES